MRLRHLALAAALAVPVRASADALIAAPGETGHDAALAELADRYDRQIHQFMTVPLGWGLEATVPSPDHRAAIEEFFASGAADFLEHTGLHPYQVISEYGESGDLGMFGGVQAAGDAFRYAALRDGGADPAIVDAARAAFVRALRGLHWYVQITGEPGCVARGLLRVVPEDGDPPLPGTPPATVPLFDDAGHPQPPDKSPTWRADRSGELPFLIWLDDSSKDQLDGWVFAVGAAWDVATGDPTIPSDAVDALAEDARAVGLRLLEPVEVAPDVTVDLAMVDADGRPTSFHDLSAEELAPGLVLEGVRNGFNAWMALGTLRTLYHVSGDEQIGRFYYEQLLGARDYLSAVRESLSLVYLGSQTNYSNVNMAFVAAYGVVRYESDPALGDELRGLLASQLYTPGRARDGEDLGQGFFDVMFAGFGPSGSTGPGRTALERGLANLREFPAPPTWNRRVDNCDAGEVASRDCVGEDGTPIRVSEGQSPGDDVQADDPVPMRIRPPSNFEWRSSPYQVNGGGGDRWNPGGDFHAAYWMGRFLAATDDGADNVSPNARPAIGWPPAGSDAGPGADAGADRDAGSSDAGTTVSDDGGCGCRAMPTRTRLPPLLLVMLIAGPWRRRTRAAVAPRPAGERGAG